jgi:hypothetical protein
MPKASGLGDNFYIGGFDLSGDVASLDQISGGPALIDVTPINASANARLGGLRDGNMQFTTSMDIDATAEHAILSTLPRTDAIGSYLRGTTLLNPAACISGKQIGYDPSRDNTGKLTLKVEVQSNGFGLEWGKQVTAGLRTDGSATTGAAVDDNGAGTSFGAQVYLQLVAFTGTSVDITVTHATTSGGSYSTLIDFGSLTAVQAKRVAAAGTVSRFLKIVTAGTFSNAVFAVVLCRNPVAVSF